MPIPSLETDRLTLRPFTLGFRSRSQNRAVGPMLKPGPSHREAML